MTEFICVNNVRKWALSCGGIKQFGYVSVFTISSDGFELQQDLKSASNREKL